VATANSPLSSTVRRAILVITAQTAGVSSPGEKTSYCHTAIGRSRRCLTWLFRAPPDDKSLGDPAGPPGLSPPPDYARTTCRRGEEVIRGKGGGEKEKEGVEEGELEGGMRCSCSTEGIGGRRTSEKLNRCVVLRGAYPGQLLRRG
ncbi:hypothetical protein BaRGS_00021987, partial [Batillaria attramentaria]